MGIFTPWAIVSRDNLGEFLRCLPIEEEEEEASYSLHQEKFIPRPRARYLKMSGQEVTTQ